jgi:hypothetical protein
MRRAMVIAVALAAALAIVSPAKAAETDAARFARLGVRARIDPQDPNGDSLYSWIMTAKFRNRSASRSWVGTCRIAWSVNYVFGVYPDANGVEEFPLRLKPDAPTLVRTRLLADVEVMATDTVADVEIRRCWES